MTDLVGKILKNRYHVSSLLGSGGMAEVYQVWDEKRSTHLAMKVLREDLAEDEIFIHRFKREAQTLEKLQHPNIVHFYGFEQVGTLSFILMDYVDGRTLRTEIAERKSPFSYDRILEIMQPVCSALQYAHNMGKVHCDIKPGNIMIEKSGRVLLTDLGIARESDVVTTATMAGFGAPAYMSPEQIQGEKPTPHSDIYSLGIVLFELLSGGKRPFTGDKAQIGGTTADRVRWEQLNLTAPSPLIYNRTISPQLESVVKKCLHKQPEGRYKTVTEFLNDLNKAMERPIDTEVENKPTRTKPIALCIGGGIVLLVMTALFMTFRSNSQKKSLISALMTLTADYISTPATGFTVLPPKKNTTQETEKQTGYPPESAVQPTAEPQNTAPAATQDIAAQTYKTTGWIHFRQNDQFGLSSINTIKPDGTDSYAMTITDNYIYRDPSISLKSNKIFYVGNSMGNYRIYYYISGEALQSITGANDNYFYPALSPAGDRVAAVKDTGTENSLRIIDQYGGNANQIYTTTAGKIEHPVWTPGGTSLIFSINTGGMYTIHSIKPDGSGLKPIIIENNVSSWASLSPDGYWLVTTQGQLGARNLLLVDLQSKQVRTIPIQGDAYMPSFSPDGEWIVFSGFKDNPGLPNGCEIYIIRRDGSDLRRVTNNLLCDEEPAWGN